MVDDVLLQLLTSPNQFHSPSTSDDAQPREVFISLVLLMVHTPSTKYLADDTSPMNYRPHY